jgi:hypothetical protein
MRGSHKEGARIPLLGAHAICVARLMGSGWGLVQGLLRQHLEESSYTSGSFEGGRRGAIKTGKYATRSSKKAR